ncbi:MAG: hypothetical protein ACJAZ2_001645 [Glaciecola sp.]|jgi:hypothetical protein
MKYLIPMFIGIATLTLFGCNKVRSYQINILNETGYEILEMTLHGKTEYTFSVPLDGETGKEIIEWEGSRTGWGGPLGFTYIVNSFSDSNFVYTDSSRCGWNVTVEDMSQDEMNILTLKLHSSNDTSSTCGPYRFKIDYQEY